MFIYINKIWKICIELADDRNLMTEKNRRIICDVKRCRKQTLAEITNCVNDVLPQPLSSHTVRRHLRSCGFVRRKIWKQIIISRVNREISSVINFGGLPVRCQFFMFCRYFHRLKNFQTQD